jgi:acetyl esterase/lipase
MMDWKFAFQLIQPTYDAIFSRLPFTYRWRLLLLQIVSPITYSIGYLPWVFSKRYTVHYIPTRAGRSVRAIVFRPPPRQGVQGLRPLHIDVHGGGFLGGIPEYEAKFLDSLSNQTGAVVVSAQYRYAPKHPYPAAIDDVDDVVDFLIKNAAKKFNANPELLTMSGFSAGGNLSLATCLQPVCHGSSPTAVKAAVTFYAAVKS